MRYALAFWNVHRLFSPHGDVIKAALEGENGTNGADAVDWKLSVIAAVIDQLAERDGVPLLVGLSEVSNSDLADEIAKRCATARLRSIDQLARDETGRGLDALNIVALVNTDLVEKVTRLRSHDIVGTFNNRDVLECHLQLKGGEELICLINHWPSRRESEGLYGRQAAAAYVGRMVRAATRFSMDEMWDERERRMILPSEEDLLARSRTPVVVMGDFNDEPFDRSLEVIGSINDPSSFAREFDSLHGQRGYARLRAYLEDRPQLFNPWWTHVGRTGTLHYRNSWRIYDQILISRSITDGSGPFRYLNQFARIFDLDSVTVGEVEWRLTNAGSPPKPIAYEAGKRGCSDHRLVSLSVEVSDAP